MAESVQKVWLYGNHGKLNYGIRQYVIDDDSGLSELPKDVGIGSSCFVMSSGDIYMLNSQRKWVKSVSGNGTGEEASGSDDGGSEGGGEDSPTPTPSEEDGDVVYDGGEVH